MATAITARAAPARPLTDLSPTRDEIRDDVLAGLLATPKRLPSKYFYDARGSRLFEQITQQPEYYLTRVELELLEQALPDIVAVIGPHRHVVEYGSGSGRKTRLLLGALHAPAAYTAIEISRASLIEGTAQLAMEFPRLPMLPLCADFSRPVPVPPAPRTASGRLLFFPGSTLGNFVDADAVRLLAAMRTTMGRCGQALVGIDLIKAPELIEAAYNDANGITAAFTLNLLVRLNREIGSDFAPDRFRHRAVYARTRRRIETDLVSRRRQTVHIGGRAIAFAAGEAVRVEYSCKYDDASFASLAARAGLRVVRGWNDPRDWFGLRLLQPGDCLRGGAAPSR